MKLNPQNKGQWMHVKCVFAVVCNYINLLENKTKTTSSDNSFNVKHFLKCLKCPFWIVKKNIFLINIPRLI